MDLILLGFALVFLLAFNAFFVLAEFAIVKVRSSRVAELVDAGNARAKSLLSIQKRIDEYLGVCQVGITLASIALGMVGGKATDVILGPAKHGMTRYLIAMGISYVVVSGSHICWASRCLSHRDSDRRWPRAGRGDAAAVLSRALLSRPLVDEDGGPIHTAAHRDSAVSGKAQRSESELRIILDHFQERGVLSFRRLLFMENVFDLGGLVVSDAMRPRERVICLQAWQPWSETLPTIRGARFTRYPLIDEDPERPLGFVHLKDILIREHDTPLNLKKVGAAPAQDHRNNPARGVACRYAASAYPHGVGKKPRGPLDRLDYAGGHH